MVEGVCEYAIELNDGNDVYEIEASGLSGSTGIKRSGLYLARRYT